MNESIRQEMVAAAISAFDLCGNASNAVRDVGADYGLSRKDVDAILSSILIEANERYQRSKP